MSLVLQLRAVNNTLQSVISGLIFPVYTKTWTKNLKGEDVLVENGVLETGYGDVRLSDVSLPVDRFFVYLWPVPTEKPAMGPMSFLFNDNGDVKTVTTTISVDTRDYWCFDLNGYAYRGSPNRLQYIPHKNWYVEHFDYTDRVTPPKCVSFWVNGVDRVFFRVD